MFANDFNKGGVVKSYFVSVTIHLLIFFLVFFYQQRQRSKLVDYKLVEITMIQEIPDQPKPIQIEKPKKMFDILKQVIPIKQKAQIEIAKPKKLEIDKPKLEMNKPKALSLDKTKIENLKPANKPIDLDNEIGRKKISPAMVQAQIDLQKKQALASAPSIKIDLGAKTKKSGFLPAANPSNVSLDSRKMETGIKQSSLKIDKLTSEKKKLLASENINIDKKINKKKALIIQGDIAGRKVLVAKKPPYPRWAQEQGLEASVTIYFVVRPDGSVKDNLIIERSSNYPELDQLAKEALLQFKFAPISGSDEQSGYATFRYTLER